jgi:hypothetical protein
VQVKEEIEADPDFLKPYAVESSKKGGMAVPERQANEVGAAA